MTTSAVFLFRTWTYPSREMSKGAWGFSAGLVNEFKNQPFGFKSKVLGREGGDLSLAASNVFKYLRRNSSFHCHRRFCIEGQC